MEESIRINTRLLQDHVSVVMEEKRTAQQLYSQVEALKRISDDSTLYQYNRILNRIEILIQYYQKMAEALESVSEGAMSLYRQTLGILRNDADEAKNVVSNTFL